MLKETCFRLENIQAINVNSIVISIEIWYLVLEMVKVWARQSKTEPPFCK